MILIKVGQHVSEMNAVAVKILVVRFSYNQTKH